MILHSRPHDFVSWRCWVFIKAVAQENRDASQLSMPHQIQVETAWQSLPCLPMLTVRQKMSRMDQPAVSALNFYPSHGGLLTPFSLDPCQSPLKVGIFSPIVQPPQRGFNPTSTSFTDLILSLWSISPNDLKTSTTLHIPTFIYYWQIFRSTLAIPARSLPA